MHVRHFGFWLKFSHFLHCLPPFTSSHGPPLAYCYSCQWDPLRRRESPRGKATRGDKKYIWFVFSSMRFASSRVGGSFQLHALVWFARFSIPKTVELLVAFGCFLAISLRPKIETIKSFDVRCHKRKTEKSSRILHGYSK